MADIDLMLSGRVLDIMHGAPHPAAPYPLPSTHHGGGAQHGGAQRSGSYRAAAEERADASRYARMEVVEAERARLATVKGRGGFRQSASHRNSEREPPPPPTAPLASSRDELDASVANAPATVGPLPYAAILQQQAVGPAQAPPLPSPFPAPYTPPLPPPIGQLGLAVSSASSAQAVGMPYPQIFPPNTHPQPSLRMPPPPAQQPVLPLTRSPFAAFPQQLQQVTQQANRPNFSADDAPYQQ